MVKTGISQLKFGQRDAGLVKANCVRGSINLVKFRFISEVGTNLQHFLILNCYLKNNV